MIHHTKNNQNTSVQAGFTLVELMLAMAFVSFILLFIVFALVEVMGSYNKGIVVKQINQTSRTVVEEMSRLGRSTDAEAVNTSAIPNGRVCFGGVSYVWNIRGNETDNRYTDGSLVTLARVEDGAGALCASGAGGYPAVDPSKAVSLLGSQVWVQDLQVAVSANLTLIDMSLRLSTADDNRPTGTGPDGFVCEGGKAGNYCAVATFSTTVSTRNGGE
jgi:prepilin-type N-terminal cleavage/methylation domain-containing protein